MFAAGVSEAFDMLYERYKHRIYRFAAASLRSMSCAEEVVQDVFMRLASAAPTYQPRGKFTAWLFTIAANRIRSRFHQNSVWSAHGQLVQFSDSNPNPEIPDMSQTGNPEHRAIVQEQIQQALQALPANTRMLLLLKEVEGLSLADAAATQGITPENARVLIHRGRKQMLQTIHRNTGRS